MSANDESEDLSQSRHKELCLALNMDSTSAEKSWEAYREIRNNFTLDGDEKHWLCCALYVACRKSMTPTVGKPGAVVEGNCVSLTRLLRVSNISLNEFFKKMKKWCEMASVPPEFRSRVDRLERSFAVSTLLYQKFSPIFRDLFICPQNEDTRVGKGKKVKITPCTANKVFELCWCLFICAKGEYPQQSVDLVTSFHMLLCCADLIFSNAIVDNRRDLINSNFPGIPEEWKKGGRITSPICVMTELCERHEGTIIDAMETKRYTWKNVIKSFFDKNLLTGDSENFMNILSMGNFEANLKSLNNLYETYTLSCGEFDERIFLNHADIGSNRLGGLTPKCDVKEGFDKNVPFDDSIKPLVKGTPLTRRDYLPGKNFLTPVATATQSVKKLRSMLADYDGKPHNSLNDLFLACDRNPAPKIENILVKMSKKFCDNFQPNGHERFRLAEALYYRLLENVVRGEIKKKPLDLNNFLNQEIIYSTLIVCSVEIVLTAYNSQRKFPWILDLLNLDAYNFYKIIEIVVMYHQDLLTRDIIKHLNMIEEQCLESLIWTSRSPIWEKIKHHTSNNGQLPTWKDVARRNSGDLSGVTPHSPSYSRRPDDLDNNHFLMSPVHSTMFINGNVQSPSKAMAKMQLFKPGNCSRDDPAKDQSKDMKPLIENRLNGDTNGGLRSNIINNPPTNRNNYGSLGLFFRKFYELAYPRMKDLCLELGMYDDDLLKKIWTIFEYSIVERTQLMTDRHLDQILMCAIYVINRVTRLEKTFSDIMKFYRNQPQADSHVYRSVLICRKSDSDNSLDKNSETSAPVPEGPTRPSDLAGTSTSHDNEERGDIIKFYNTVYVQVMQKFALKFSNHASSTEVQLSPLPQGRVNLLSPKKISANHSLYIHPLERKEVVPESPEHSITYNLYSSPAKDLQKINHIVANGEPKRNDVIKRNLPFDDTFTFPTSKIIKLENDCMNRKLKNIIHERQDNNNPE